jgi:hypothetical protein
MASEPHDASVEWERFRAYLGLRARWRLGTRLPGKVDRAGVVQHTPRRSES